MKGRYIPKVGYTVARRTKRLLRDIDNRKTEDALVLTLARYKGDERYTWHVQRYSAGGMTNLNLSGSTDSPDSVLAFVHRLNDTPENRSSAKGGVTQ